MENCMHREGCNAGLFVPGSLRVSRSYL
jgi:hypothetical protein